MTSLTQQLLHALHPLLSGSPATLRVAYSGGVDSHALLHCLASIRKQLNGWGLSAVHVNHGLSQYADQWQAHCKQVCAELGVPFESIRVTVDKLSEQGVEAAARRVRYEALIGACDVGDIILLGQHANDQLETLLLQLKRGAGPQGLASMPQVKHLEDDIVLLRPWLHNTREQIETYAQQQALGHITDDSNEDERFDRNFLRNRILPELLQRWPAMLQTAARSAQLCAEQQSLLDEITEQKLQSCLDSQQRLSLEPLLMLSMQWQQQVLRHWLKLSVASLPSAAQLSQIIQLCTSKEDANPEVQLGHWRIKRFDGNLYCVGNEPTLPDGSLKPDEFDCIDLPQGWKLQLHKAKDKTANVTELPGVWTQLEVRFNQPLGQRLKPHNEDHSKPLKQWFKLWKIPPWERPAIPLIYSQDTLVALIFDGQILVDQYAQERIFGTTKVSLSRADKGADIPL